MQSAAEPWDLASMCYLLAAERNRSFSRSDSWLMRKNFSLAPRSASFQAGTDFYFCQRPPRKLLLFAFIHFILFFISFWSSQIHKGLQQGEHPKMLNTLLYNFSWNLIWLTNAFHTHSPSKQTNKTDIHFSWKKVTFWEYCLNYR